MEVYISRLLIELDLRNTFREEILISLDWFSLRLKELYSALVLKCSSVDQLHQNHQVISPEILVL